MKNKKGISLIALIITIIVIIILAAIVIGTALTTPESANRAKFASDMSEVQHAVSIKLANNYNQFITNPDSIDLNAGFTRVSVTGAPESFDSFALQGAESGTIGYLVRLDTIKMEPLTIGQEYKTATEVTFGTTDAFVYDAEGEVFYALGYKYDGTTYYSIADLEAGGVAVVNPGGEEPSEEPSVPGLPPSPTEWFEITESGEIYASSVLKNLAEKVDLVIPTEINNIKTTAIYYRGFYDVKTINKVVIPEGVTSIDQMAFENSSLTEIVIPEGVTTLPIFMCDNCTSLTSVTLPSTLTRISSYAFSGTLNISQIIIPLSVTRIDSYAFYNWKSTQKIIFEGRTSMDGITVVSGWNGSATIDYQ